MRVCSSSALAGANGLLLAGLVVLTAACGSSPIRESSPQLQATSEVAPADMPTTPADVATSVEFTFDDLDTVGLDDSVDGVLEVYCLLDVNGEAHSVDTPLALSGFDPDDLPSMQWVHEVIRSSDGSAEFIRASFADPKVESDLDRTSQIVLSDSTKTFLFQNKVPLIDVETIYPFRTGATSASVLTTYVLDDVQQMLTQRWVLDQGAWVRV